MVVTPVPVLNVPPDAVAPTLIVPVPPTVTFVAPFCVKTDPLPITRRAPPLTKMSPLELNVPLVETLPMLTLPVALTVITPVPVVNAPPEIAVPILIAPMPPEAAPTVIVSLPTCPKVVNRELTLMLPAAEPVPTLKLPTSTPALVSMFRMPAPSLPTVTSPAGAKLPLAELR